MTHRLLSTLALLTCAGALAQQPASPDEIMARNDVNEDGVITRAEAEEADTPLATIFDRVDADGDGRITLEELQNMRPPR